MSTPAASRDAKAPLFQSVDRAGRRERAGARAPGRAGDDQAAGGAGVDVLPHVSGRTGITAYLWDLDVTEAAPDHSMLSRTRRRIDVETWVLDRLTEAGLPGNFRWPWDALLPARRQYRHERGRRWTRA